MKSKSFEKLLSATLITGLFVASAFAFSHSNGVVANQQDKCNETFTYTKSNDFSDSRVNINFESNDDQIDVSAASGYQVIEVQLDVDNDGQSGFVVYATGPLNNFNPNPGDDINEAKVKVKKVCPTSTPTATPTAKPTVTPTATPSPTPSVTPTVTPYVTPYVDVSPSPTPTVTPTEEPSVTPTVTPTATPTPTDNGGGGSSSSSSSSVGGASASASEQSVQGLSTTSGANPNSAVLLFTSFLLLGLGARLTFKNA